MTNNETGFTDSADEHRARPSSRLVCIWCGIELAEHQGPEEECTWKPVRSVQRQAGKWQAYKRATGQVVTEQEEGAKS